jgi:hypothetical protein
VLADARAPGAGAFAFVAPTAAPMPLPSSTARALAASRDFEILHFVPLYHPSADRAALASALRAAAVTPARAPTARAEFLVAALTQSLSADARRAHLPALAAALEERRVEAPDPVRLAALQRALDSLYRPALLPWLRAERLDAGRLIVSPSIGPEGRLFAATADRADNLAAVGAFPRDPDPEAPLLAFAREICFPVVTRASQGARGFSVADAASARRAGLAAVRCGAQLLDTLLPSRAEAYRAFWLRQSGAPEGRARFEQIFPPDEALTAAITAAVRRVAPATP